MADYEVELKFPLRDGAAVVERLTALGGAVQPAVLQVDRYFAHPLRDFALTDEALRLRSVGEANILTYKGPLLDDATKTRQELEVSVAPGSDGAQSLWAILRALGFEDVRTVVKRRQSYRLRWEGRDFSVALDQVEELGEFLEIETLAAAEDWPRARDAALRLAAELHVQDSIRRSYLELLLDRDRAASATTESAGATPST